MKKSKGFTLIELVIVIAIFAVIAAVSIPQFDILKKKTELNSAVQEFASVVRLAQIKTLSDESTVQYGVYINNSGTHSYTLYQGSSYAGRDQSKDKVYYLPSSVEFYSVDLALSSGQPKSEITFNRVSGTSQESGSVSFWGVSILPSGSEGSEGSEQLSSEEMRTASKTVYISFSGSVGFDPPVVFSDDPRVKDWRHIHVSYSRTIDTANENIVLNFNNGAETETIPIKDNLSGGLFYWKGTVNVAGSDQVITVLTHLLNDPASGTVFSVHRDARYNNTILKVSLSDDAGYFLGYSADGQSITHTSVYASNFERQ